MFLFHDLHMHTDFSDGRNDCATMFQAAVSYGMKGIAITDHAFNDEQAEALLEAYAQAPAPPPGLQVLYGVETCVRSDGCAAVSAKLLRRFDPVLMDFNQAVFSSLPEALSPRAKAEILTGLMIRACEVNPQVKIMAHPFNFGNPPVSLDLSEFTTVQLERIAGAFAKNCKVFELMNQMYYWHQAVPFEEFSEEYARIVTVFMRAGVCFSLGSDAHSCCGIGNFRWCHDLLKKIRSSVKWYLPPSFIQSTNHKRNQSHEKFIPCPPA